jgi:chemotaxis signal transduction protein
MSIRHIGGIQVQCSNSLKEYQVVVFTLSGKTYAADIGGIEKIVITNRKAPTYRTSLGGKVIPILKLKSQLGLKDNECGDYVIIVGKDHDYTGVVVDRILTVTRIPESSIKFEIAHDFGSKAEYIEGTFRSDTDSTVILDLMRIIEDAKIQCEVCQVV